MKSGGNGPNAGGGDCFGLSHQKERQRKVARKIAGEPLYFRKALLKHAGSPLHVPSEKPARDSCLSLGPIPGPFLAPFLTCIFFCFYF